MDFTSNVHVVADAHYKMLFYKAMIKTLILILFSELRVFLFFKREVFSIELLYHTCGK
uniref:Uncharacterized protein n=1 Tax=Bartonella rochalimae ATCC BAA-1498 TaxID=685782 RepID=E6YMU9_9HYPH|nr:hypothetical protein BARRO_80051 [Bartonella rochalimae ATCC BAA-1498]